jgi:hypothetical protein
MSYKNNQFFRAPSSEINRGSSEQTNNPFEDPRSKVQGTFAKYGGFANETFNLRRGFIRSLTNVGQINALQFRNIKSKRCQFQFNPTSITQNVTMRQGLANMFLQDPAQFSQPVAGDTAFAFTLLFDRQVEYNNGSDTTQGGAQGTASEANIGVLTDLRSLYEIIGQGINEDQINLAIARAQTNFRAESFNEAPVDPATREEVGEEALVERAREFYESNFGNNAFLIPLPVRLVFSSLYMIDGYVTSTQVTFTKFSRTFVPIQCQVGITMQAIYLGYAKQKTFLTDNLDRAKNTLIEQIQANQEVVNTVTNIFDVTPPQFSIQLDTNVVPQSTSSSPPDFGWQWFGRSGKAGYFLYDYYDYESNKETFINSFNRRIKVTANFSDIQEQLEALLETPEGAGVQITINIEVLFYGPNVLPGAFDNIVGPLPLISKVTKSLVLNGKDGIQKLKDGTTITLERSDYSQINTNYKKSQVYNNTFNGTAGSANHVARSVVTVFTNIGGTQTFSARYRESVVGFTPNANSIPRMELTRAV